MLVGWRTWRTVESWNPTSAQREPLLVGAWGGAWWWDRPAEPARCRPGVADSDAKLRVRIKARQRARSAPHKGCLCGFHAYLDAKQLPHAVADGNVLGLVCGWGPTYLHELGFRSRQMALCAIVDLASAAPSDISVALSRIGGLMRGEAEFGSASERAFEEQRLAAAALPRRIARAYDLPLIDREHARAWFSEWA